MQVDVNSLVPVSEAGQGFAKIAEIVDAHGAAIILSNDCPRYVVVDYGRFVELEKAQGRKPVGEELELLWLEY